MDHSQVVDPDEQQQQQHHQVLLLVCIHPKLLK
jgi:hypothetical protein